MTPICTQHRKITQKTTSDKETIIMSEYNDHTANAPAGAETTVAESAKKTRRKPPKTLEERFLEKQQEAEKLRLQIEERREKLRQGSGAPGP